MQPLGSDTLLLGSGSCRPRAFTESKPFGNDSQYSELDRNSFCLPNATSHKSI